MIGGNIDLKLQTKTAEYNEIGSRNIVWTTKQTLCGWLDFSSGEAGRANFNAKIQETTHIFICDFVELEDGNEAEKYRAVINDKAYDVLLIDDPMEMHKQLEIYLKYTGGQNG